MLDLIWKIGKKIHDFFTIKLTVKKENISKEYLAQYKLENGYDNYKKMLKRLSGALEAMIIKNAKMGRGRDHDLELKLMLVREEIGRL